MPWRQHTTGRKGCWVPFLCTVLEGRPGHSLSTWSGLLGSLATSPCKVRKASWALEGKHPGRLKSISSLCPDALLGLSSLLGTPLAHKAVHCKDFVWGEKNECCCMRYHHCHHRHHRCCYCVSVEIAGASIVVVVVVVVAVGCCCCRCHC